MKMASFIIDITEEETIQCHVCNKVFNTEEITTDDYYFAWDNTVDVDCCAECGGELRWHS
tara:strand:- start:312 stop:491 length:180 start_codon:yes stop_codon:yes gene_type:complete